MPRRREERTFRAYATLLRAYPAGFRREFGADMLQLCRDRARSGRSVWGWALRDLLTTAPRMRWEEGAMKTSIVGMLAAVAVSIGAAMLVIGGGPGDIAVAAVVILAGIAAIVLVPLVAGRRYGRATEALYRADGRRGFTWWLVPAAGLGAFEIAGGFMKVAEELKLENVLVLVTFSVFAATIALGMLLRSRGLNTGNILVAFAVVPSATVTWSVVPPVIALAVIIGALVEIGTHNRPSPATSSGTPAGSV